MLALVASSSLTGLAKRCSSGGGGGKNIQYGHEQTNSPIVCSNFSFFSDPAMLVNKSFVLESHKAPIVVPSVVAVGMGGGVIPFT